MNEVMKNEKNIWSGAGAWPVASRLHDDDPVVHTIAALYMGSATWSDTNRAAVTWNSIFVLKNFGSCAFINGCGDSHFTFGVHL